MGKRPVPLRDYIKKLMGRKQSDSEAGAADVPTSLPVDTPDLAGEALAKPLKENVNRIKSVLGNPGDLIVREFWIGWGQQIRAALINIDGLIDKNFASDNILKALMLEARMTAPCEVSPQEAYREVKDRALSAGEVKESRELKALIDSILSGDSILLLDGFDQAIIVSTKGWPKRSVTEPETDKAVRGPREGFTETLRDNTALMRRKIRSPRLRMETFKIGEVTQTDVVMIYLAGICPQELAAEVRTRLKRIKIDAILESGYIEDLIEDNSFSPFPQIFHSERPDAVAAEVLEGRVAILVDGTPFALTMPISINSLLQAPEDYFERPHIAVLVRTLRYMSLFIALTLPAFYIAVISFHQEMLPTDLIISIAAGREAMPFPAAVEAFLLEISLEILREASIRLPSGIGQPISIVGALILGQSAVQAGLVSPSMVIIVAITGIASFTIPSFSTAIALRLLRFPLMILGAALGMWGVMWGLTLLLIHLVSLRSFGLPYMAPFAPLHMSDLKDTFYRLHWWNMRTRPTIGYLNRTRVAKNMKPAPPPVHPDAELNREESDVKKDQGGDDDPTGKD